MTINCIKIITVEHDNCGNDTAYIFNDIQSFARLDR